MAIDPHGQLQAPVDLPGHKKSALASTAGAISCSCAHGRQTPGVGHRSTRTAAGARGSPWA
ncbi:hypothetical protein SC09_contig10orf00062 [Bacillus subtilis]|uniref:Uncharacterized protein n=1 Tax=Bacillus subtilis TaxID=1423 RepID=A0A0D1JBW7_BACIU|nr:hypothetical protein SC09_contig10orf00060 [Bacillus subtilis]KIU09880.1 hypothetical protein SC09_contig10orf00062 [Bacillus subtilis]